MLVAQVIVAAAGVALFATLLIEVLGALAYLVARVIVPAVLRLRARQ